jgi:hypothetical protein
VLLAILGLRMDGTRDVRESAADADTNVAGNPPAGQTASASAASEGTAASKDSTASGDSTALKDSTDKTTETRDDGGSALSTGP